MAIFATALLLADDVVTGTITGVVSSLIVLLLGAILKYIVIPWYEGVVYKGINVSGSWRSMLPEHVVRGAPSRTVENILQITQHGHKISGTITKVEFEDKTKRSDSNSFKIIGSIKDRLILGYVDSDPGERIAAMAFVFEVRGDGRVMKGGQAFYDIDKEAVETINREWQKVS